VTGETTEELRARRDAASRADLVELRLDYVRQPDVAGALAGRRVPVIVTCRPGWEGGTFLGSEEERRRLLEQALELGAEYVDIEWRAAFGDLVRVRGGRGILLSMHDFAGVPRDLVERYRQMRSTGAAVVKVAVAAKTLCDILPLAELRRTDPSGRCALIAMGMAGMASRVLAAKLGCCWTYAGDAVAPGQVGLDRMLDEFGFRGITPATDIYGVVGKPIGHSLSPAMHNVGFAAAGLNAAYLPLEAADVDDFVGFSTALGLRGASVTAPYKQTLLGRVDEIDELSRQIGAINTVRIGNGRWLGRNTDVAGFLEPLECRLPIAGLRAAIVGAGGAARAAAVALASRGARVTVCARDPRQAAAVARLTGARARGLPPQRGSWDILVNTTPVGIYPDVEATPLAGVTLDGRLVYDLVYNPPATRLLRDARAAGCETIGGLEMLVAQAVRQFEWWTGERPSPELFADAARRRLAAQQLVSWNSDS
jgi:3-dehydroquinate dehydratase/shikimate dehydrogenase